MWANSLRRQLLFWMLLPLAAAAMFNVWTSYQDALTLADLTADRALLASARVIAENINASDGIIEANIPPSALELFVSDTRDVVTYQVRAPDGQLLAGNPDLKTPPDDLTSFVPIYFTTIHRGNPVRAVALGQPVISKNGGGMASVIVAQTESGHDALVNSLLKKVMRDQILLSVVAIVLALFGLRQVLAPLGRLSRIIKDRDGRNFAPIPTPAVQTELRPLVDALNAALQGIEAQVANQRRFVANAAHQIRTPLALLKTQSLVGQQTKSGREKDEALTAIGKNVDGLSRLATQLLNLARAEQGSNLLRKEEVDLNAITRSAVEAMLPISFERDIDLGFEGPDEAISFIGHASLLREAITNLIDNALRHTLGGGFVTVRIRQVAELVVIAVEDTGPGIAEAERDQVFERFHRGSNTVGDGSGLGLAIVREIAAAHDGTIELATREPPPGLLVRLTLPMSER